MDGYDEDFNRNSGKTKTDNNGVNFNAGYSWKERKLLKIKKKAAFKIAVLIICSVALGNVIGFGAGYYKNDIKNYFETDMAGGEDPSESSAAAGNNPIENVSASVVSIMTVSEDEQMNPFNGSVESSESQFTGSGIIFHQTMKNIYIVTNYHVISGGLSVSVSFNNEDFVPAKLVGKQQYSDIAVISIERESLKKLGVSSVKTAYFGDSDKMSVGDSVIAIGNALGKGNTATKGIISVASKDIAVGGNESLSCLQTDAAINVGNDGGPLINSRGEVIGINTAKSTYYTVEGIGYSISSNVAKPIIEEIMNKKEFPYLGVYVTSIGGENQTQQDSPEAGVYVEKVVEGGAADIAGIKESDIITGFNKEPVFTPTQLIESVKKCNVGDSVEVKIVRGGKRIITLNVIIQKESSNNF